MSSASAARARRVLTVDSVFVIEPSVSSDHLCHRSFLHLCHPTICDIVPLSICDIVPLSISGIVVSSIHCCSQICGVIGVFRQSARTLGFFHFPHLRSKCPDRCGVATGRGYTRTERKAEQMSFAVCEN